MEEELKKRQLAEETRTKEKVTLDDKKEANSRKKYVDDVVNVYENLEAWKDRVYDKICPKLNKTDSSFMLEKYDLYKNMLTENCRSDSTWEEKVTELEKLMVDIETLQKGSKSYLQKVRPLKMKVPTKEPIWFLKEDKIKDFAKNMTDSTMTNLKNS